MHITELYFRGEKIFIENFKNAIKGEYNCFNFNINNKKNKISLRNAKQGILIKIKAQSPAKLKGIKNTIKKLWKLSKKIYLKI